MDSFLVSSDGELVLRLHDQMTLFALEAIEVVDIVSFQRPTTLSAYHDYVIGVVTIRGTSMPVIDLSLAMGGEGVPLSEQGAQTLVVVECKRMKVAFMVDKVQHIMPCDWKSIMSLPEAAWQDTFVLGSTRYNNQLVQLLDVERILTEIFPVDIEDAGVQLSQEELMLLQRLDVLVVDDSFIVRRLMSELLDRFDLRYQLCRSGDEALALLLDIKETGAKFDMVLSCVELPGIDGYELVLALNDDPRTRAIYTILHASLSSEVSQERAQEVGANEVLSKFHAQEFIAAISRGAKVSFGCASDKWHGG